MKERQYIRSASKQIYQNKQYLVNYVEAFLAEATNKNEDQVIKIYNRYDVMWVEKCMEHEAKNNVRKERNQVVTLLADAFESSCNSGRKSVANMPRPKNANELVFKLQQEEYKRIFRIVEHKSLLSKIAYWFEKHFLVKSKTYNLNGTLKPQLK